MLESALPSPVYELANLSMESFTGLYYKVSFSHCGKSIGITMPNWAWPLFIPLPKIDDGSSCKKRKRTESDFKDAVDDDPKKTRLLANDDLASAQSRLRDLPSVLSGLPVSLDNGSSQFGGDNAVLNIKANPGEISINTHQGNRTDNVSITKLPSYIPINLASATITLPTTTTRQEESAPVTCNVLIVQNTVSPKGAMPHRPRLICR